VRSRSSGELIMKGLRLPQFRIRSMMLWIGAIACTLALAQWLGPGLPIVFSVFPLSLLVERVLGGHPRAPFARRSSSGTASSLAALILGATLCTLAAWCGSWQGMPRVLSPLPLFVVVPLFASGDPRFWWIVGPIPFGAFVLMNLYQLRIASPAPLPTRFPVLLGLATAFSGCWFIGGWEYGVRYQGASYTQAVALINFSFLAVLWGWWLAVRRRAHRAAAFGFATLLHSWLFWFAFPWLGELP
jgi:hypothetical protein